MSSTEVERLIAVVDASVESLRAEMARGADEVAKFQRTVDGKLGQIDARFDRLGTSAGKSLGVIKSAFAGLVAAVSVREISQMVTASLDAVGGLGELAQQAGVTTDTLQILQYATTQTGVSAEELHAGLARLTRTIGQAAEGNKAAISAFEALGVKILDASGKARSTDAVLLDVAAALAKIPDPSARAAREVALFGKSGQQLDPILNGLNGTMGQFSDGAYRAGMVIENSLIGQADKASDHIAELRKQFSDEFNRSIAENAEKFELLAVGYAHVLEQLVKIAAWMADNPEVLGALGGAYAGSKVGGVAGALVGGVGGGVAAGIADEMTTPSPTAANIKATRQALRQALKQRESLNPLMADYVFVDQKVSKLREQLKVMLAQADAESRSAGLTRQSSDVASPAKVSVAGVSNPTPKSKAKKDKLHHVGGLNAESLRNMISGSSDYQDSIEQSAIAAAKARKDALDGYADDLRRIELEQLRADASMATSTKERVRLTKAAILKELDITIAAYERKAEAIKASSPDEVAAIHAVIGALKAQATAAFKAADTEQQRKRILEMQEYARDLASTISSGFEDAILSGKSFGGILKGLGEDILRLTIRFAAIEPLARRLADVFSGADSGGGGILSMLSSAVSSIFGGFRADGGPVQAGKAYVVGERRPELFVPSVSGMVVPEVPRVGGGVSVTHVINVDARQSTDPAMVRQQVMEGLTVMMPSIKQQTTAAVYERLQRPRL